MVQFPLRPSYRPMPNAPRAARIKPNNNLLQLDYEVDQRSEHFDKDAEDYLKQKYLRLHSSSVPALTNYTVGVFRQGQLHLTPVTSVLQMRPSLAHIDDAVEDEEDGALLLLLAVTVALRTHSFTIACCTRYCGYVRVDMEVTAEQEQKEAAAANEVKEVQFQFKKKQSERAISAIQSSYAFKKQQINAEQWRELQVKDKNVRVPYMCNIHNFVYWTSNMGNLVTGAERGCGRRVRAPVQRARRRSHDRHVA